MKTSVKLPAGASDAHVHVFRPDVYPYARDRAYTPGRITRADLATFLEAHGLKRVVIVQPSVYGTDNRALVDALLELGPRRARGIAVVDIERVSDEALADLDAAGVVGIRLNVATREKGDLAKALRAADKRLAGTDWHIQIYAPMAAIVEAEKPLSRLKRPVVLDHFGGARTGHPVVADGLRVLMRLLRDGPAYAKLSGAYRVSDNAVTRWDDAAPLAVALIDAAPERLVWGSDWPHTGGHGGRGAKTKIEPCQKIDDRAALAALTRWAGDKAMLKRILVDTPRELYRFG